MSRIDVILRLILSLAGIAAVFASWFALVGVAENLPRQVRMLSISLSPGEDELYILGRAELMQLPEGATSEEHIAIERTQAGAIVAYDIAMDRRLGYTLKGGAYADTSRVLIPQGESYLHVGDALWVAVRDETELSLRNAAGNTHVALTPEGARLRHGTAVNSVSVSLWQQAAALMRGQNSRYRIGGHVADGRIGTAIEAWQIPDDRLPPDAALLIFDGAGWALSRGQMPVAVEQGQQIDSAEASQILLVDEDGIQRVDTLTVGRTRYSLAYFAEENKLTLSPTKRRVWLSPASVEPLSDGVPIARQQTDQQKRLEPDSLGLSSLLICVAVLGVVLPLTTWVRLRGARAVGIASAGMVLTLLPSKTFGGLLFAAVGVALLSVGLYALVFTRLHSLRWRVFNVSLLVVGTGIAFLGITAFAPTNSLLSLPAHEMALTGAWLALAAPFVSPLLPSVAALFWSLFVIVSAFALVAGARLSFLEPTERWVPLFEKHLFALSVIGLSVALILGIAREGGLPAIRRALLPLRRNRLLKALAIIAGSMFVFVTLIGDETGFFGVFQPSEFAKSTLVLLVAATLLGDLARRTMLSVSEGALDLWTPTIAVLMALSILAASALNYDMSPILVSGLAIFSALVAGTIVHTVQLGRRRQVRRNQGLPIARLSRHAGAVSEFSRDEGSVQLMWRVLRREIQMRSSLWPVALLSLLCLTLFAVACWLWTHESFRSGATSIPESWMITPWKRVQSWYDMALSAGEGPIVFPETGLQLRLAREALLEAPCRLIASWCPKGVPSMLSPDALPMLLSVPAVQDDFAAVSLVHTFGLDGALLYAAAQAALVSTALAIGLMTLVSRPVFWLGAWLTGCATVGAAGIVTAQILLAWGNVLGFFPIMGQPMTFVSFGASHHLGVALPFAALTMTAALFVSPRNSVQDDIRVELYRYRDRQ